jgi:signal transduction histidine kinase
MIQGFAPEVDGRVLVCTGQGLLELNRRHVTLQPAHRLMELVPQGPVTTFTFAEQADHALWLGTWSRGLWRVDLDEGTVHRVDTVAGPWGRLPNRKVLCWRMSRDGTAWVGLNDGGGLARLHNGRWTSVVDADQANVGGVVRCIAEAPDRRLWLGTHEQGVVVHDPVTGSNEWVGRRQGLPGARILALQCLGNGEVWLATPQGVAYRPVGARHFTAFPMPSALADQEHTAGLLPLTDGRLAIGVGGRVLLHDPSIGPVAGLPVPVFTGHRVNDAQALGAPEALTLPFGRTALVLELGALGVRPTLVPVFRYRILPSDTAWHEIGAATRLDLFELTPGAHVVEVQVSTDGAQWSTMSAKASVEVLPPFHATWWFRAGVLLLVALGLFLAFRNYLAGQLRRQRQAFEREQAVLAERMRIAEDMHDDMGAGLSALKLRSEMALRVEKDPLKREQLGSLARTAGELIGSMRQIIWTMNADQGTVADLIAYTTNYARQYCDQNGLNLAVATDGAAANDQLSAEQRRNIFLVVKESLHNMVKHAAAHKAALDMVFKKGELEVRIADDGPGFPHGLGSSEGNGLRNMRRRMEALGGTLEVGNGLFPGLPGASIRIRMPAQAPNLRSIGHRSVPDDLRNA